MEFKKNKVSKFIVILLITTVVTIFTTMNFSNKVYAQDAEFENRDIENLTIYDHPGLKDDYSNDEFVSKNQLIEMVLGDYVIAPVRFRVTGRNVLSDIYIDGKHYVYQETFTEESDLSLFENRKDAFFANDGKTEAQIVINLDSERHYLRNILVKPKEERPAFVPHSIWFLKTGEIKTVQKYDTYLYFENYDNVITAFFYTPDIVIDKILNFTMEYYMQKETKRLFGFITEKGSPELFRFAGADGRYMQKYKKTNTWFRDTFNDAMGYLDKLLKLLGDSGSAYVQGKNPKELSGIGVDKERIPQIQEFKRNSTEESRSIIRKMEAHFKAQDKNFDSATFHEKTIYQLSLEDGTKKFSGFLNSKSESWKVYNNLDDEADEYNARIISIVYETEGKIYETSDSDMNLFIGLGPEIAPFLPGDDDDGMGLKEYIVKLLKIGGGVIIGVTTVAIVISIVKQTTSKAKKEIEKRDKNDY